MNIEDVAQIAHEVNKAYCEALGDNSQPEWKDVPNQQKDSVINGVIFHMNNPEESPSSSHDSWMKQKTEEGWKYGPVKDPVKKEHPYYVPYDQLPIDQKVKDYLFRQIVHSLKAFVQTPV
jgi:hypothetical protein